MESKKFWAIIASLFFPGLGNIIDGERRKGLYLFIASMFLTLFYFVPLFFFLLPTDQWTIYWIITGTIALIALIIDLGLMVLSIYWIVKKS